MNRKPIVLEMQHVLKGAFPHTVPLAEGIDLPSLTEGDDAPMFLTLPIATETTSRNGVKYQRKDVERIVSAINAREIIGGKGHLTEAERSHRFDTPSLFWVGATLDEKGVAWGKAYIPRTADDVREYVRVAKAMNSKIGTSIYGMADINEAGEIVGDSLVLEQIDMVNPSRVGVPQATGVPIVTQEAVITEESSSPKKETPMDPKTEAKPTEATQGAITELEKNLQLQVDTLTAKVRELNVEKATTTPKLNAYNGIYEMVGKPADGDVLRAVQAKLMELEALKTENLVLLESAMVLAIAEKVKAESVRPIVLELVKGEKPASKSEMNVALEKVLAKESIKAMLRTSAITEMGPPQQRPATPTSDEGEIFIHIPNEK